MKAITAVLLIIGISLLVIGGNLLCQNKQERLASIPPSTPMDFTATKVSATQIDLAWKDTSNNELGFRIFRDGQKLTELPKDVSVFTDYEVEPSTIYEYELVAFNNAGESKKVTLKVKTSNPPITVWLDKIGVIDNGEDFFRELLDKHGEIYLGVVVRDGANLPQIRRLPTEGFYNLADNAEIEVRELIFTTNAVGDYLNINIIGFEHDCGGLGDDLLIEALNFAVTSSMGNLYSIILMVAGVDFRDTIREIGGFRDDFLGEYYHQWPQSDNWGAGSYENTPCDKENGLRLWFTIRREI